MNIYIEIEVLKRELVGKLLLSLQLINYGHNIYLTTRDNINNLAINKHLQPGVIFLKDLNPENYRIKNYITLVKNGFTLVSQDEEIGCFKDESFKKFFIDRFQGQSSKTFNFIDKYFCWGKFDFEFLKKQKLKTKFYNTGSPRIDLCINKSKLKNKKKRILICLNQNIFWGRDFLERHNIAMAGDIKKKSIKTLEKTMFYNEGMDLILTYHLYDLIKELNILNKYEIIIRPHPAMNEKKVIQLFKDKRKFPNIKISGEGSLIDQISDSNIIIHSGCTSGIEATLKNKLVICFYPNNNLLKNYKKKIFLMQIGFNLNSPKSILKFIKNTHLNKKKINNKILQDKLKIKKRVNIDGISYKRIVNELTKIEIVKNYKNKNVDHVFKKKKFRSYIKKKIKEKIVNILDMPTNYLIHNDYKFPPLNKINIFKKAKQLNNDFNLKSNFQISLIGEKCLRIHSKN